MATQVRFLELTRACQVDEAVKLFKQAQREHPGHLLLGARALNTLGYELMPDRARWARELFELNVELHPDSWNVHDKPGRVLHGGGRTGQGDRVLREVIGTQPGQPAWRCCESWVPVEARASLPPRLTTPSNPPARRPWRRTAGRRDAAARPLDRSRQGVLTCNVRLGGDGEVVGFR